MGKEVDRDYEALLESYEDALMRVVMYRVAREDGRRLLEEAEELERSGFEVPKELDEKCLKLIKKSCASAKRKTASAPVGAEAPPHGFRLHKVGQMVVAAILAAVLLFGVAYAVNDDFRVSVLNFFLEIRENGTQFFFGDAGPGSKTFNEDEDFPFEFTYIPDGYELLIQETRDMGANGRGFYNRYVFPGDDNNNFFFEVTPISEGTGLFFDTEDAIITDVEINGCRGQLVQKIEPLFGKECYMYYWFDLENRKVFTYNSVGISPKRSQKIFEGIVLNGEYIKIH